MMFDNTRKQRQYIGNVKKKYRKSINRAQI